MKNRFKSWWFRLLRKDPEAVVVSFRSGDDTLAQAMCDEIQALEPTRKHFSVAPGESYWDLRKRFRHHRIGLAPVLFTAAPTKGSSTSEDQRFRALRRTAFLLAPSKILAYNARLERHHLKLTTPIASWLFLRGIPLDRIFLRPRWFSSWRKDKTVRPTGHRLHEGRPRNSRRRTVAVLSPYFPYPLSHGGAVRIFNLLREMAREIDILLYAFTEGDVTEADLAPVLEFVTRVYLVEKPRYREPRWSTLAPPEVGEYDSPEMARLLDTCFQQGEADLLQIEYTQLASYRNITRPKPQPSGSTTTARIADILVEHDVTFDLYNQVLARRQTLSARWDWWRWQRYERRAVRRFDRVVVMSEKDRQLLGVEQARVIENGVDLQRFRPQIEPHARRLLFIGSFRHFPNIVAFRFLTEEILPLVPDFELTVVAGPDPWLHWRNHTGTLEPSLDPRIRILEFVADVRPLYHEANVVLVPTLESAGTNVKVLEALAMQRAIVSTESGCAGIGLLHRTTAWIADTPAEFALGIRTLLDDAALRVHIAQAGRAHMAKRFDWRSIGTRQRALLRELVGDPLTLRIATRDDLPSIAAIQAASTTASQWSPENYLVYHCRVAVAEGKLVGFVVSRQTGPGEREILNIAVDAAWRRLGVARRLLEEEFRLSPHSAWFLEVRESNTPAMHFYRTLGFTESGRRDGYYYNPVEAAIVMRVFS